MRSGIMHATFIRRQALVRTTQTVAACALGSSLAPLQAAPEQPPPRLDGRKLTIGLSTLGFETLANAEAEAAGEEGAPVRGEALFTGAGIMVPVPKLTIFELISSASGTCNWNLLLELLGNVGNPVSAVVSRLHGRSKLNSRKLLCQIHCWL